MGYGVGDVLRWLIPAGGVNAAGFAVIGMASFFSGVVHAPLTGVTLIMEMTSNFKLAFPMMVASLAAFIVSEWGGGVPVYEMLLNEDLRRSGPPPVLFQEPISLHIQVEAGSDLDGRTLAHVALPSGALVVRVNRAGSSFVPSGDTLIEAGDRLELMISGDAAPLAAEISDLGASSGRGR